MYAVGYRVHMLESMCEMQDSCIELQAACPTMVRLQSIAKLSRRLSRCISKDVSFVGLAAEVSVRAHR
jgi:hypothetical protein